jgi:hypothetical protein
MCCCVFPSSIIPLMTHHNNHFNPNDLSNHTLSNDFPFALFIFFKGRPFERSRVDVFCVNFKRKRPRTVFVFNQNRSSVRGSRPFFFFCCGKKWLFGGKWINYYSLPKLSCPVVFTKHVFSPVALALLEWSLWTTHEVTEHQSGSWELVDALGLIDQVADGPVLFDIGSGCAPYGHTYIYIYVYR